LKIIIAFYEFGIVIAGNELQSHRKKIPGNIQIKSFLPEALESVVR